MKDLKGILENWRRKKVLMTVFPHPDDETMASGGLLLAAKRLGWKTVVVVLTKGGAGKVFGNPDGLSTTQLREKELKKAAKILMIDGLIIGDFDDGKLKQQEQEAKNWLLPLLRQYQPGVVVSFGHSGLTGHPDHIVSSLVVKEILESKQGRLNNPVLLWASVGEELKNLLVFRRAKKYFSQPTHQLDIGWDWIRKWRAARAHRSQQLGKDLPWPLWYFLLKYHCEWYHKVDLKKDYPYSFVDFPL